MWWVVLIFLMLCPVQALAVPDCNDSNAAELHDNDTNTSLSLSYTTPAPCVDCVAFYGAGVRAGGARTYGSVQIGSSAMTEIETTTLASGGVTYGMLYYEIDPPSGTNNFTATVSGGSITNRNQIGWTCSGVHQTTPISDSGSNVSTSSTAVSTTVSTDATQTIIDFFATDDSGVASVGASQTVIHQGESGSTGAGASRQAGSVDGVMTWTLSATDDWIHIAASLNAAPSGHYLLRPIYMH